MKKMTATMWTGEMKEGDSQTVELEIDGSTNTGDYIIELKDPDNKTQLPALSLDLAEAQALYADLEEFLSKVG